MNVTAFATAVGWTEETLNFDRWDQDPRDHTGVSGSTEGLSNATVATFVTWNVTTIVDAWVNGILVNHGFRMHGATSGSGLANLASHEALITTERPVLTVRYIRVIPSDPSVHPLTPFILTLGVPPDLFLIVLGILALVLTYFGLYVAHNPEQFGARRSPSLRDLLLGRRRR